MRKFDHMLRLIRAEHLTSEQIEESVSLICDSDTGSSDLLLTFSEADLVWLCKMVHSDGLLKGYEEKQECEDCGSTVFDSLGCCVACQEERW